MGRMISLIPCPRYVYMVAHCVKTKVVQKKKITKDLRKRRESLLAFRYIARIYVMISPFCFFPWTISGIFTLSPFLIMGDTTSIISTIDQVNAAFLTSRSVRARERERLCGSDSPSHIIPRGFFSKSCKRSTSVGPIEASRWHSDMPSFFLDRKSAKQ